VTGENLRPSARPGSPRPLGARCDGAGVNFALFSAHAERVEVCLFDADGRHERARIALPECTDEVWHGYVPGLAPGALYGYRVHGPHDPAAGHRFNPHKLLVDPYARQLAGQRRWTDAHYGHRAGRERHARCADTRDNAADAPKCVVLAEPETVARAGPRVPWEDTVVYELHVRGFTMRHPSVPEPLRGTFAGLAHPEVIAHIVDLGVTTVELMPVQAFVDEPFLVERGLRNYWGYSPIAFFAPEQRYLAGDDIGEFRDMVRCFHEAGLEVLLDVVFNHTGEGDQRGPTLGFRGIDNASYYVLEAHDRGRYVDDTGCGNTLDLTHPRVLQMVMDSLRHWVECMGVDGFRFDLATTLARERDGFDPGSGFLDAVGQDPVLGGCKLVAEPWDVGPDGYRLGGFPPGWAEWNDRYRDAVRRFWRGDGDVAPELATRLLASSDCFEHRARRPWASVNYVTSHDGFTLSDLVSYRERHNEDNGEHNRDGHAENFSDNHGVEGPSDDPAVNAVRSRQRRNLVATLLLSQGTPMLLAGDEIGRSQRGNNNAYCQDNEIGWLDWPGVGDDERRFLDFVRAVLAFRRAHPVLRRARFLHGRETSPSTGLPDISWLAPEGGAMGGDRWHWNPARCVGLLLAGDAATGAGSPAQAPDETLLIVLNADPEPASFTLPEIAGTAGWRRVLDTDAEPEVATGAAVAGTVGVAGRSLAVLALAAADAGSAPGVPGA